MQVLVSHLVFEQSFDGVEVMSSASMDDQTRWLANYHIIFSFLYDFNRQVETRRLGSDGCVKDLIPIFKHILTRYLSIVNRNHSVQNTLLVVLRRIRLKLLDQRGKQLLANPPSLRKSAVDVRIRLHESEGIEAAIDRPGLFFGCLHYISIPQHLYNFIGYKCQYEVVPQQYASAEANQPGQRLRY